MITAKKLSGSDFVKKFGSEKFTENTFAYIVYENDLEIGFCIYKNFGNTGNILEIIINNTNDIMERELLFDLLIRSVMNDMEISGAEIVLADKNVFESEFMIKLAEKIGFKIQNNSYKMILTGFFDQKCSGCSGDCSKCEK